MRITTKKFARALGVSIREARKRLAHFVETQEASNAQFFHVVETGIPDVWEISEGPALPGMREIDARVRQGQNVVAVCEDVMEANGWKPIA